MSCQPCASKDFLPKCAIYAILNRLYCSLCNTTRHKRRKYEDFRCAVRILSRYSINPQGGSAGFLGLRDNDVTKFTAVYIDNIRGEYDPNIGAHKIYHIAYVVYGDTNAVCRSLRQKSLVIAGNTDEDTGASPIEGTVALKSFLSQGGIRPDGSTPMPIGFNMPFAGNSPLLIPGTAADIYSGSENFGGFGGVF